MNAILGIDVSKAKLDVALLWGKDQKRHKVFVNTPLGFQKMLDWVLAYTQDPLYVCTESTGVYDEAVLEFFHDQGHTVSRLNPMAVKAFGKSMLTRTKTDAKDSVVIAQFCRAHTPPAWTPAPAHIRQFKALSRCLETLKEDYTRACNRLEKTANTKDCPSRKIWLHQAETLEYAIKDVEKQLKIMIDNHPDLKEPSALLQTIPGVGETTAWKFLAEIPELSGFSDAKQLAAYAGVTPRHRQSGSSVRGQSRLSKMGSSRLRTALYFPVLVAIKHNPILRAFYAQLIQKGMTAIGACMRKLIHMVFGVLKHQKPFNPQVLG